MQRKSFEGPAVPAEETLLAVIDNLQKPKRQSSGRKKVETLQPLPAAPEVILIPPEPPKENTVPPTTATEPLSVTTNFIRDKTKDPVHCTELLTEMYGRWKALEVMEIQLVVWREINPVFCPGRLSSLQRNTWLISGISPFECGVS